MATATTTTTADPPFDFAQGSLFGDDNKKSKCNGNSNRRMWWHQQ